MDVSSCSVAWLCVCLVGWLVVWLVGCLVGCSLFVCLFAWPGPVFEHQTSVLRSIEDGLKVLLRCNSCATCQKKTTGKATQLTTATGRSCLENSRL